MNTEEMKRQYQHQKKLIVELVENHRIFKSELLDLMGKFNQPNMTKDALRDELFKLYLKIK